MIVSCIALLRKDYFHIIYRIFAYLPKYFNTEIVIHLLVWNAHMNEYHYRNYLSEYSIIINDNPRDCKLIIKEKIDIDHTLETIIRRSRTSFVVYFNLASIY